VAALAVPVNKSGLATFNEASTWLLLTGHSGAACFNVTSQAKQRFRASLSRTSGPFFRISESRNSEGNSQGKPDRTERQAPAFQCFGREGTHYQIHLDVIASELGAPRRHEQCFTTLTAERTPIVEAEPVCVSAPTSPER
jgi:hypothetical protein